MIFLRIGIGLALAMLLSQTLNANLNLIYPGRESKDDQRDLYPIELLHLALNEIGVPHTLEATTLPMQQGRALSLLKDNQIINLAWSMTSSDREADLLPIRIPIFKGLIGYRLLLTHKDFQHELSQIQSVEDVDILLDHTYIQEGDWPDTEILRTNGFNVLTAPKYEVLFTKIEKKVAHFFPRSINEIWAEYEKYKDRDIVIEPHVLLRYPAAVYFFVHKSNTETAKIIENGLLKIIDNGKFDQLFLKYYGENLKKGNISNRVIFDLGNPLLPNETPVMEEKFWLDY